MKKSKERPRFCSGIFTVALGFYTGIILLSVALRTVTKRWIVWYLPSSQSPGSAIIACRVGGSPAFVIPVLLVSPAPDRHAELSQRAVEIKRMLTALVQKLTAES